MFGTHIKLIIVYLIDEWRMNYGEQLLKSKR